MLQRNAKRLIQQSKLAVLPHGPASCCSSFSFARIPVKTAAKQAVSKFEQIRTYSADTSNKSEKSSGSPSTAPSFWESRVKLWNAEAEKYKEQCKQKQKPIRVTAIRKKEAEKTEEEVTVDSAIAFKTLPIEIAKQILPRNVVKELVAAQVSYANGEADSWVSWDLLRPLEGDCKLKFCGFDSLEGKEVFWHSSSHILGLALEDLYGKHEIKLCDGPALVNKKRTSQQSVSGGFFYEAFMDKEQVSDKVFADLEKKASQIVKSQFPFERIEVSRDVAKQIFSYNQFKLDIIEKIPEDQQITLYKCGNLIDLCTGPHLPNTGIVKAIKVHKTSGSYWTMKNHGPNEQPITLQRVYGISFPSQQELKDWETKIEEAAKRDHRNIGKVQDLFMFHEWSPGTPFFFPHGTRIFTKFIEFLREQYRLRGYEEVISPQLYNKQLWETSGHWQYYKDDMFTIQQGVGCHHDHSHEHSEEEVMGLKPMNCPGHCLMFGSKLRSYRELPIRWADFSPLHRNELAGALTGLTRVRRFHQDDSHIFCTQEQIFQEISQCLDFVKYVYSVFQFKLVLRLSTRPEKFIGDIEMWNQAENSLKQCLNNLGFEWELNEGDGAFYGPKIDIAIQDSLERQHQCATIQLDFQLPQRFNLRYQAEDGRLHTPVMIHRAIMGSLERFMAMLIEHTGGKWPFWLSPRQAVVLPISEKFLDYAKQVSQQINQANFYCDVDTTDNTLNKKIREAQLSQYNFILIVGEKEVGDSTVTIRRRDSPQHQETWTVPKLLEEFNRLDRSKEFK